MANPRQRRKARSSAASNRPSKRSLKNQRKVTHTLQEWDRKLTVRQNYAKLGLLHKLDSRLSGGIEQSAKPPAPIQTEDAAAAAAAAATTTAEEDSDAIPAGYARLVRDAEGNVIDVIFGADVEDAQPVASTSATPWGAPMEQCSGDEADEGDGEDVEEAAVAQGIAVGTSGRIRKGKAVEPKSDFVRALEEQALAAAALPTVPRHASSAEIDFLVELYRKHGTDEDKMARDRKVNQYQHSAGEIRKRVKRAGGWEVVKDAAERS